MALPQQNDELCPSCGEWVEVLRDDTGWCTECSGGDYCPRCDLKFKKDQSRLYCSRCRSLFWLEDNADKIEAYLADGEGFSQAKSHVQDDNRSNCLQCGDPINKGYFCKHKKACRQAYTRYKYKRYRKGIPKADALKEAVQ